MRTDTRERGGIAGNRAGKPSPYDVMRERPDALERLDIRFRWGGYGFRVLRFHWTTFPPGKVIGFHKHSEYEFHFIPRGKGIVVMDGTVHPLRDGMFYLTGPDVSHYQEADVREGMDELCLHLDIVRLEEREIAGAPGRGADAASPGVAAAGFGTDSWGNEWEAEEAEECVRGLAAMPRRPAADRYRAMDCFLTAYRAWHENQAGLYTIIKQAIVQILLRSVRAHGEKPAETALPARDMNEYRFQLAAQFIQDNYARPITLEDVAEKIRISGRQLQRIFREKSLGSFSEYVETVRLAGVCESLVRTGDTIERIALEHGFSSGNYLYYVFKKRLRMTPGEYRKLHAK